MRGIYTINKSWTKLAIIAFFAAFLINLPQETFAQYACNTCADIPRLSLTGGVDYDEDWYADARILAPVSARTKKLIYVPVFIENKWNPSAKPSGYPDTLADGTPVDPFDVKPITSFEFSLMFNKNSIVPVGITTEHPESFLKLEKPGTEYDCDAKDWEIAYSWQHSPLYRDFIQTPVNAVDSIPGSRMIISGVSATKNLPNHTGYRILLYAIFEVVPTSSIPGGASESQLYILNDEIIYNDMDITDNPPFLEYEDYLEDIGETYGTYYFKSSWPNPRHSWPYLASLAVDNDQRFNLRHPGLTGIENFTIFENQVPPTTPSRPSLPGMIYVNLLPVNEIPTLDFEIEGRPIPQLLPTQTQKFNNIDIFTEIAMIDPITEDDCNPGASLPLREVILQNTSPGTRIENLRVETSAPWLEVETNRQKGLDFLPDRTTDGLIAYVDNGTLGQTAPLTVENKLPKGDAGKVILNITVDPSQLSSTDEYEGKYTGYITFTSDNMLNSPVRLKVEFILFRGADEGRKTPGTNCGVTLNIENSAVVPEKATMIFGTGDRATNGPDILFGERAYTSPLTGFGARFYPWDKDGNPLTDSDGNPVEGYQYGFSDWNPNDETPRSNSRDIRNAKDTNQSIIYYVRFNENGDANYPVVVSWDTRDFLPGSNLFIRDTDNGQSFPSVNMRLANTPNQAQPWLKTFTIQDQRVNDFLIEYTLPRTIDYVDENGDPIIKAGWNFLSMPVKPVNSRFDVMYPNAINVPIFFVPNNYQQEEVLKVGRGYFMKYSDQVDVKFAGTSITEISVQNGDAPRVYPAEGGRGGWNSVGSISYPTSVNCINFANFGASTPTKAYTLKNGVWRYITNKGYEEVTQLLPGLGYWIKVDKNGYYELTDCGLKETDNNFSKEEYYAKSDLVRIKDASNNDGKIYFSNNDNLDYNLFEMPPVPPTNVFDIRFADNNKLTNKNEATILVQGVTYPINVNLEFAKANYTLYDAVTNRLLATINKGESKNIEISSLTGDQIRVVVEEVTSSDNLAIYPNPISDRFVVEYKNMIEGNVEVTLFNTVGSQVAVLFNGNVALGNQTLNIDLSSLNAISTGTYAVKVKTLAGEFTKLVTIQKP